MTASNFTANVLILISHLETSNKGFCVLWTINNTKIKKTIVNFNFSYIMNNPSIMTFFKKLGDNFSRLFLNYKVSCIMYIIHVI